MPESPRYLVLHGKEEKAIRVLAMISKINCKPMLSGRLVTLEEKRRLQLEKDRECSSSTSIQSSYSSSSDTPVKDILEDTEYEILQDEAKDDKIVNNKIPPDIVSDVELLLVSSNDYTHQETLSCTHIKSVTKRKAVGYFHWFMILFKNGYWRTTLLLWYLW